jgi:ribonucleoside-diphosphate reductase alpha chain
MVHPELVEDEIFRPESQAVISVPQKAPEGAVLRTESVFDLLERVKKWNTEWVHSGHRSGANTHNVSCTISVKEDEWESVGEWMWDNKDNYNGIAVLPYDGGTYKQAPFEDIDEETYNEMYKTIGYIDLSQVYEETDNTDLKGEVACSGGECVVTEL